MARLAGDEFTIILEGVRNINPRRLVAGEIVRAMQRPFDVQGNQLAIST
jgi:predicted signal transduction protein with EAL and GGDEF domain